MIAYLMRWLCALGLAAIASCGRAKKPPTCGELADHVATLFVPVDDHARDVQAVFRERCEQDQWSPAMRSCVGSTRAVYEPKGCKRQLTETQRQALDAALAKAEDREADRRIPDSCVQYERILGQVMQCEVLPKDVRDDLKHKLDTAKQGWGAVPNKRSLDPICAAAIQAVRAATAECPGAGKW